MRNVTLKALRARDGLTQKQVAEKLGLSLQGYMQKENGIREFTQSEINILLDFFGADYEQVFFAQKVSVNKTSTLFSRIKSKLASGK